MLPLLLVKARRPELSRSGQPRHPSAGEIGMSVVVIEERRGDCESVALQVWGCGEG